VDWKLSEGEGQRMVYVQFRDRAGNKSEPVEANITLPPRVDGGVGLGVGEGDLPTSRGLK
jgi:hypothetical protein